MIPNEVLGFRVSRFPEFPEGKIPGAYVIRHVASGMFYVGSTKDLYARRKFHESALRRNHHPVVDLQRHYSIEPYVEFVCWITDTIEEALLVEQRLVDLFYSTGKLYNKGTIVDRPAAGLKLSEERKAFISKVHSGKKVSIETKKKMSESRPGPYSEERLADFRRRNKHLVRAISIDGVIYASAREASEKLGIAERTIGWRAESVSDRFSSWFFVDPKHDSRKK